VVGALREFLPNFDNLDNVIVPETNVLTDRLPVDTTTPRNIFHDILVRKPQHG
jgi:hypothetical protein